MLSIAERSNTSVTQSRSIPMEHAFIPCVIQFANEQGIHVIPLDSRCSVEIPTWSSAEFKVPREHRRSCEMIGFRSVDHPNDSVEPCFLPLPRVRFCTHGFLRSRQTMRSNRSNLRETYFSNFSSLFSPNWKRAMGSNRTRYKQLLIRKLIFRINYSIIV